MLVQQPPERKPTPTHDTELAPLDKLATLAVLRLVLAGESVVDLPRMWFANRESVDHFLRLCEFDTDNPLDMQRLRELHHEATVYLTETQNYRLPTQVEELQGIHDLFLLASHAPLRIRRYACMTLKVMHIMHHVAGREVVFNTPISEAQLLERLSSKVFNVIDRMRASGIGVQEFAAGQKTRMSLVTKLLAKRSTLASQIFDKLRFRLVMNTRDDLVQAVLYMTQHLFPFNYVVPEESQNGIVSVADVSRAIALPESIVRAYWERSGVAHSEPVTTVNEFSGADYRSVNFVADIPLRIDDIAPDASPAVAFVLTEIQLVDAETEKSNNRGENSHPLYKKRQRLRVRRRLEGPDVDPFAGLVPAEEEPKE